MRNRPRRSNRLRSTGWAVLLFALGVHSLPAGGSGEPAHDSGLRLYSGLTVPFGDRQEPVTAGGVVELSRYSVIRWAPFLTPELELAWALFPTGPDVGDPAADERINAGRLGVGLGGRFRLKERLRLAARGSGGAAATFRGFALPTQWTWYASAAAGLGYAFSEAATLGLEARYTHLDGFADTISATLGLDFSWRSAASPGAASRPSTGLRPDPGETSRGASPRGGARPVPLTDNQPAARLQESSVRELTLKVKAGPERHLESLVQALIAGGRDDFEKVRVIHDWIAVNIAYDAEAFFGRSPMITDPLAVIRRGASVCAGYAAVFQTMCRMAGIESVVVSGYGRGVGFDPQQDEIPPFEVNHDWNAVRIGDLWYLVDCTWNAGHLNPETSRFTPNYGTAYLFTEPSGFLHTHFPQNPAWQLVDRPVSYPEFHQKPYLRGVFFQYGFSVADSVTRLTQADDRLTLDLGADRGGDILAVLEGANGDRHDHRTYLRRDGGRVALQITFPAPGRYTLTLFASKPGSSGPGQDYRQIGELIVQASGRSSAVFPRLPSTPSVASVTIKTPVPYEPAVKEEAALSFSAPPDVELKGLLLVDGSHTSIGQRVLAEQDGTDWTIRATFPDRGEYELIVMANRRQNPLERGEVIATFPFTVLQGTDRRLPLLYANYEKEGWHLVTPLVNPLPRGAEIRFEVIPRDPSAADVPGLQVRTGKTRVPLTRGPDGRFRGTVRTEGAELMLEVVREGVFTGLARYEVR